MTRAARFAAHINELAAAFKVHLVIDKDMHPAAAGAGNIVMQCLLCGQKNRIPRVGIARCGRCKCALGRFDMVDAVKIAPVDGDATYAVALHELGHRVMPLGSLRSEMSATMQATHQVSTIRDVVLQLEQERAAWTWAHHHALEWTPIMTAVEQNGIASYEVHARRILGRLP